MWTPQLPQALLWDHNRHYHPWLLRQLPPRIDRVLDVGCGSGELARRLCDRSGQVDAVDISPQMIDQARSVSGPGKVDWLVGDVLDEGLPLSTYDVVTAVASLHHMPFRPALSRMAGLLRPGGTLAIVGLYRQTTVSDYALTVVALPANGAMGLALATLGRAGKRHQTDMPVKDPTTTFADLRTAAADLVPGARIRRHLFWRYSLTWRRPVVSPLPA